MSKIVADGFLIFNRRISLLLLFLVIIVQVDIPYYHIVYDCITYISTELQNNNYIVRTNRIACIAPSF